MGFTHNNVTETNEEPASIQEQERFVILVVDDEEALLELAKLLDANPDLAIYHRYRDYAPGNIPEQHLREQRIGHEAFGDEPHAARARGGLPHPSLERDELEEILGDVIQCRLDAGLLA